MDDMKTELENWLKQINNYKTPYIDALPDLDLYMDQVITYMEKILGPLLLNTDDRVITSSMINNYVKGNVIPNPVSKKYSKDHLIFIIAVCTLKQVLPIADISKLIPISADSSDNYYLYDIFRNSQDEALKTVTDQALLQISNLNGDSEEDDLKIMAMKLAIEGYAKKMVSERILYFIEQKRKNEIEEIRKKAQKVEEEKENKRKEEAKELKEQEILRQEAEKKNASN